MKNQEYPILAKNQVIYGQLWAPKVELVTVFKSKKGSRKVQKEETHDVCL
jgi:hypothetical protein